MKKNDETHRLVLGTVQLGMDYGIANKTGKPCFLNALSIVKTAWENGIREFDTAQAYGNSEKILGQIIKNIGINEEAKVITKLDPVVDTNSEKSIREAVDNSILNIGLNKLYGVLLHRENLLNRWKNTIGSTLIKLKNEGKTEYLGVSVDSPEGALKALNEENIDIIQVPSNLIDRRFERVDFFKKANKLSKKVYVRSIFLQGLILLNFNDLPKPIHFAFETIKKVQLLAEELNCSCHHLAISYVKKAYPYAQIIFGAETPKQVKVNIAVWEKEVSRFDVNVVGNLFNNVSEQILNPNLWPK